MKKFLLVITVLTMALLTACSNEGKLDDDIHENLSQLIQEENEVDELRVKVNENVNEEQEIYDSIMDLPADDREEMESYAEEAETILSETEQLVDEIETLIDDSSSYVVELKNIQTNLSSGDKKDKLQEVIATIENRRDLLNDYNIYYREVIDHSQNLYSTIKEKGILHNDVYDIVNRVNEKYDDILQLNNDVLEKTDEVNQLQEELYDLL